MSWILLGALFAPTVLLFAQEVPPGASQPDAQKEREKAIAKARALLHGKLDVAEDKMSLKSATSATWPDSALGCPEKGHMYAQVVTRGWAIVLEVEGKTHEVHVAGSRAVACPPKQPSKPDPPC